MSFDTEIEREVEEVFKAKSVSKAKTLVASKKGRNILAAISFFESALPIPILTDPFLIAAVMLDRAHTVRLVVITTIASAAGGVAAYFMALFFFDLFANWMSPDVLNEFNTIVNDQHYSTSVITILGAVTPIPYTTVAWVIAVIKGNLLVFIIASLLGRGIRYGIVGYSTYRFGHLAVAYAKRYVGIASLIVLILVMIYFWYKFNM